MRGWRMAAQAAWVVACVSTALADDVPRLLLEAFPADRVFTGAALALPVRVTNGTARVVTGRLSVALRDYRPNETGATVAVCERQVAVQPGGVADAEVRFAPPTAGPHAFHVALAVSNAPAAEADGTLLFNPDDWSLPVLEPRDFDGFWAATLAEMRTRPLEASEAVPSDPRTPAPFREVSFNGLGTRRIRGYFALPPQAAPGHRVPAILSLPSAGYHSAAADPATVSNGYAFLAISIHDLPFGGGGTYRDHPPASEFAEPYQGIGRASRETFYYRAAYAAGVRAVDYLRARPEIDPARIVVTGFSQGGSLALVTAALVPDLALVEAGIPGRIRMDLLTFVYKANMSLDPPPGLSRQEMLDHTLLYFDVASFASRIRCPALLRVSLDDPVNPGALQVWAFRQIVHSPDARLVMAPGLKHAMPPDRGRVTQAMRQRYAPADPVAASQETR